MVWTKQTMLIRCLLYGYKRAKGLVGNICDPYCKLWTGKLTNQSLQVYYVSHIHCINVVYCTQCFTLNASRCFSSSLIKSSFFPLSTASPSNLVVNPPALNASDASDGTVIVGMVRGLRKQHSF